MTEGCNPKKDISEEVKLTGRQKLCMSISLLLPCNYLHYLDYFLQYFLHVHSILTTQPRMPIL